MKMVCEPKVLLCTFEGELYYSIPVYALGFSSGPEDRMCNYWISLLIMCKSSWKYNTLIPLVKKTSTHDF